MVEAARTAVRTASNGAGILRFLARRIVQGVIVILIVTLIVFALLHLAMPQGPAQGILGMQATQEQIDAFNRANGFDRPLWQQYFTFLSQIAVGDLGDSFKLNRPVADAIGQRLPKTLVLALISMVVALIVAIPMGIYQAVRRGKTGDYVFTTMNFIIYSTPSFFLGLVLVIVFAQWLHLVPALAPQRHGWRRCSRSPRASCSPSRPRRSASSRRSPATCARRRSTTSPRTTSAPPARRARRCPSSSAATWCATP